MRLGRILLAGMLVAGACGDDDDPSESERACAGSLCAVETWMHQIQGLEEPAAVDALAATDYELLVLDPSNAAVVYEQAAAAGLVPLVTRVDLSQLTETPPPSG